MGARERRTEHRRWNNSYWCLTNNRKDNDKTFRRKSTDRPSFTRRLLACPIWLEVRGPVLCISSLSTSSSRFSTSRHTVTLDFKVPGRNVYFSNTICCIYNYTTVNPSSHILIFSPCLVTELYVCRARLFH